MLHFVIKTKILTIIIVSLFQTKCNAMVACKTCNTAATCPEGNEGLPHAKNTKRALFGNHNAVTNALLYPPSYKQSWSYARDWGEGGCGQKKLDLHVLKNCM